MIVRSKLVPDFALTLHGIHLGLVSVYSGSLPRNALWWGLNGASALLMTVGGVWSCRWRELRPISFGAHDVGGGGAGAGGAKETRGDGAGEYEMVSTREDVEEGRRDT